MADQTHKPQGTFSKLMSSTRPHQGQKSEKLGSQQTGKPESQNASKLASQNTGKPAIQQSGIPKSISNKVSTEKVTYRFHAEGKYAVEDMKTILARKHGIRASLEEIAEECILLAYDDLLANQNASILANRLARQPENRNSS